MAITDQGNAKELAEKFCEGCLEDNLELPIHFTFRRFVNLCFHFRSSMGAVL